MTPQATIERYIPEHLKPLDVVMGKASYSASIHEAGGLMKTLLEGIGPVEASEINDSVSSTQVKATARFLVAEDARRAVTVIGGRKLPGLGNSRLFISPSISVKFNVLRTIYNAILADLESFKVRIWSAERVHVKVYMPTTSSQKLVVVRIYGEDTKNVAKAKCGFENILTGLTAMNGDTQIWDDFYTTTAGLAYLNELGCSNHGYVYRDTRKHRLSLFGSTEGKGNIEKALVERANRVLKNTYYMSLDPESLKKALRGGFRKITAALGSQNVTLDIQSQPKLITIVGSNHDFERAKSLLNEDLAISMEHVSLENQAGNPDCAVCWTEAEDPHRCPCDHVYCRICLSSQCTSATDLPLRCLGEAEKCQRIFGLEELRSALPSAVFEQLLEKSFTTHVRKNPQAFQYCPTPDCQQIYRVSTDGTVFTCPDCLASICTACQVTSHDGMSCAVYVRVVREGSEEFKRWKEEHDVKDCPGCGVPIEKSEGCNHMECRSCGTHICWFCLESFETGRDCYGHMQNVHSSFR
ncbi:hypothetical protein MMC21_006827 [Puttea exsequens]|nr:hypothetical protein [Puttea exsequens]